MIWGEGLNTDLVEHLGCGGVRKVRQPRPPLRGAEGGEEARAVAGDREGGKRETRAQNQVEWFP